MGRVLRVKQRFYCPGPPGFGRGKNTRLITVWRFSRSTRKRDDTVLLCATVGHCRHGKVQPES